MSIRHVHAVLHRACKDAVRWNCLPPNPVDAADPPKIGSTSRKEMKTWTAEQLGAFLDSVREDRLHPLWHTLAMTGMIRGEALGLKWEDVDLEAGRRCGRGLVPSGEADLDGIPLLFAGATEQGINRANHR